VPPGWRSRRAARRCRHGGHDGLRPRDDEDRSSLGLSIARENALIHGGDLTAHHNGSAVFTLTLPRRPETPTPAPDAL